jgi:hypothetical protein
MREAMREYLTREELPQAFADEAEKAWLDYEQDRPARHARRDRRLGKVAGYAPAQALPEMAQVVYSRTLRPTSNAFIDSWRRRTPSGSLRH